MFRSELGAGTGCIRKLVKSRWGLNKKSSKNIFSSWRKIILTFFFEKNNVNFFRILFSDFFQKNISESPKKSEHFEFFPLHKNENFQWKFSFLWREKNSKFSDFFGDSDIFFWKKSENKIRKKLTTFFRKKKSKWFFSTTKKYFSMIFYLNLIYSLPVFECIRSQLLIPSGTSLTNLE